MGNTVRREGGKKGTLLNKPRVVTTDVKGKCQKGVGERKQKGAGQKQGEVSKQRGFARKGGKGPKKNRRDTLIPLGAGPLAHDTEEATGGGPFMLGKNQGKNNEQDRDKT